MRLIIELSAINNQEIRLPVHYNYMIQALIYNALSEDFALFLHDQGYDGGGRRFKLFTFSRLMGEFRLLGQEITFQSKLRLVVSSSIALFCQNLLNGLFSKTEIRLGQVILNVDSVKVAEPKVVDNVIKFQLLSPVIAYSTLLKPDGKKYTCYFQPGEKEFTRVASENLHKKYRALYNQEPPVGEMEMRCFKQPRLHVLEYKGNMMKGYSGLLELRGPKELLQVALDAGLGSKNGMGFGCGEKV